MLSKVPLAVGLLALVFVVGSLFGAQPLGAGVTPWRLMDCLFWIGVLLLSVVALGLYSLFLQKAGLVEAAPQDPKAEGAADIVQGVGKPAPAS